MPPSLYRVFVTGSAGSNVVLLYVDDSVVAGIDAGTGTYHGTAERLANGGLRGTVNLTVAPGHPLITGGVAPPGMQAIPIQFELPASFDRGTTTLLQTPIGPVNARFEKIMNI